MGDGYDFGGGSPRATVDEGSDETSVSVHPRVYGGDEREGALVGGNCTVRQNLVRLL